MILRSDKNEPRDEGNPEAPWVGAVRVGLKVGFLMGLIYLAVVYYGRWTREPLDRTQPEPVKLPADYYVYPPKSYVMDAASAKKLVGKPLWVKEGYRWTYEPADVPFEPLERIVPTGIRQSDNQVALEFEKDGQTRSVTIGSGERFWVDEIFLLKDPKELYSHWRASVWDKIDAHEVEPGMTEHQIVFSLGAGNVVRSSTGQTTRIVDYTLCRRAGLQPVRVTYREGIAQRIEPLSSS